MRDRVKSISLSDHYTFDDDDLIRFDDELRVFFEFVKEKARTMDLKVGENQEVVQKEINRLALKNDKVIRVLCGVLLNDHLEEEIKAYANLFKKFTTKDSDFKAQRVLLMQVVEKINKQPSQMKGKANDIIGALYESGLVSAKPLMDWYVKEINDPYGVLSDKDIAEECTLLMKDVMLKYATGILASSEK